ncbi:MAG TPA: hypothetical protein DEA08_25615 [Planctomycetes bacterium]|nr:hypothetical protein [Planctomycetota bacterium]
MSEPILLSRPGRSWSSYLIVAQDLRVAQLEAAAAQALGALPTVAQVLAAEGAQVELLEPERIQLARVRAGGGFELRWRADDELTRLRVQGSDDDARAALERIAELAPELERDEVRERALAPLGACAGALLLALALAALGNFPELPSQVYRRHALTKAVLGFLIATLGPSGCHLVAGLLVAGALVYLAWWLKHPGRFPRLRRVHRVELGESSTLLREARERGWKPE